MSRVWQAERFADREEARLWKDYNDGIISRDEYNAEMRNLQREVGIGLVSNYPECLPEQDGMAYARS